MRATFQRLLSKLEDLRGRELPTYDASREALGGVPWRSFGDTDRWFVSSRAAASLDMGPPPARRSWVAVGTTLGVTSLFVGLVLCWPRANVPVEAAAAAPPPVTAPAAPAAVAPPSLVKAEPARSRTRKPARVERTRKRMLLASKAGRAHARR